MSLAASAHVLLALIHPSAWKECSPKFARRSRASSQEGGIGVARLNDSSSSEARMIAECEV